MNIVAAMLACIVLALPLDGYAAMEPNLVTEVKAIREINNGVDIDISSIVRKYVVKGSAREVVETYLTGLGFKLHFQPLKSDGIQTLVAVKRQRQTPVSHDEIRLIVLFSDGVVNSCSGRLFFQSL